MNNPVRQSFNRAATSYSATAKLQQRVADRLLEQIGHLLPDAFNGRLLDAGCGTGYCLQHLQALFPGSTIIGLDFAEHMLRQLPLDTQPRCINADIEQLPLADNSIDVTISNCTINHSRNKESVWSEVYRVLKPGGRFAVSDIYATSPIADEYRYDPEAIAECWAGAVTRVEYLTMLEEAGFCNIKILEESAPYAKGKAEVASFTVYGEKNS